MYEYVVNLHIYREKRTVITKTRQLSLRVKYFTNFLKNLTFINRNMKFEELVVYRVIVPSYLRPT